MCMDKETNGNCRVSEYLTFLSFKKKIMQQVWKDVDGVLTCDPNICPNAKPVPHLTFEEAAELAYFGAQVYIPGLFASEILGKSDYLMAREPSYLMLETVCILVTQ